MSPPPDPDPGPLTVGAAARHFGVAAWKVRRVYERGLLPPASRFGAYRLIPADQLPDLEMALRQAGYLPPEGGLPCAS